MLTTITTIGVTDDSLSNMSLFVHCPEADGDNNLYSIMMGSSYNCNGKEKTAILFLGK